MRVTSSSTFSLTNVHVTVLAWFVLLVAPAAVVSATPPDRPSVRPVQTKAVIKQEQARTPITGQANRISVPSVGIDLPVAPGSYDEKNKTWEINNQSAFHAQTSVPANDTNGTTLIYGHATAAIFARLPWVTRGAEATVYTADETQFVYTFESMEQVSPSSVDAIRADGAPKLILQTCSGLFDEYRTLVKFTFKEVRQNATQLRQ